MLTKTQIIQQYYGFKEGYSQQQWQMAENILNALEREKALRKEEYQRYLRSPRWRARWNAVMKRDNGKCRFCGKKATQVHHLTYARIFNEAMYDLVAICDGCHKLVHALEGKKE